MREQGGGRQREGSTRRGSMRCWPTKTDTNIKLTAREGVDRHVQAAVLQGEAQGHRNLVAQLRLRTGNMWQARPDAQLCT